MKSAENRRQKTAWSLQRSPWSLYGLIDQGFFIFAGLASFWLAWLVWREGWHTGGWWLVGLFVVVWAITAYLALPRLHRILSSIYVPNYFIGRTKTSDGLLGDPVNLALRGSEAQLHQAMIAAGWTLADEITPRSVWKIIIATITNRSYDQAPVTALSLFGRRQDFAYQQQVDGNPKKRHHVRFWRCPKNWLLPGGHRVDWLAAGTFDRSVGISLFTFQITHKIDENTDIERDYIVETVLTAQKQVKLTLLKDFSTGYHSRNGGGDNIKTDGDLPVLELDKIKADAIENYRSEAILDATSYENTHFEQENIIHELWSRRPPQILLGCAVIALTAGIAVAQAVLDLLNWSQLWRETVEELQKFDGLTLIDAQTAATWLIGGLIGLGLALVFIELVLAWTVLRGSSASRIALLSVASFIVVTESLSLSVGRVSVSSLTALGSIALHLFVLLMFSSDAARRFTRTRTGKKHI